MPAAFRALSFFSSQISTTKGTGGDLIVLEEAAYVDPGFFYVRTRPRRRVSLRY